MRDKIKIFEYLETLVKMCRSKNDGASLKIEESDINDKIVDINLDLQELNNTLKDEVYDESAEMADRNLEILTRKSINTLKAKLREKEIELSVLTKKEQEVTNELTIFKDNRGSYEEYIRVMEERIDSCNDSDTINQYKENIRINEDKLKEESEKSSLIKILEEKVANSIALLNQEIETITSQINKKQELLEEINHNLETKEAYEDINKKNRINKRIKELEQEKKRLEDRIKEIKQDPKYMELKIKEIINDGADAFLARSYIIDLVNKANRVPFMQMPIDNNLENELLKATKARDTFANEIDHKSYLLVDLENPTRIRIEYLEKRIAIWKEKQEAIVKEVSLIDNDEKYNYHNITKKLDNIIDDTKLDISEFTATLESGEKFVPSVMANLKASLEEKKKDLENAENIADQFRLEESMEIQSITTTLKDEYQALEEKIMNANQEIEHLKNELLLKRSDLTDIRAINKDKARLKELANMVIDIKHRRNFPLQPNLIAKQLERMLGINILDSLDNVDYKEDIQEISEENHNSSTLINDLIKKDIEEIDEQYPNNEEVINEEPESKRGLKVTEEYELATTTSEDKPLGPTLAETMANMRKEKEKHQERISFIEDDLDETKIEDMEKELQDKIASLKLNTIDNNREKEDNIVTSSKDEKINELEDFINSLDEN